MIGAVDAVTSSGYVEGWACDPQTAGVPIEISVISQGREVARGLAHRYRWDLADLGLGLGWCAFRMRVSGPVSSLLRGTVTLKDYKRDLEIIRVPKLTMVEDTESSPETLDALTFGDPTCVHSIEHLRGCISLFENFAETNGVETFIRAAYVYILGRPADYSGLKTYSELILSQQLSIYEFLSTLYASDEFRRAPRLLTAPNEPGFIFSIQ